MTLGPDDLPEDPFGETGLAQVACVCGAESLHVVLGANAVKAVCPECPAAGGSRRVVGEWPVAFEPGHGGPAGYANTTPTSIRPDVDGPVLWGDGPPRQVPPVVFSPPGVQAGAAWMSEPPPTDAEIRAARDVPPEWQGYGPQGERVVVPDLLGGSDAPIKPPGGVQPLNLSAMQSQPDVPPLPHFSSGQCNIYLDGGPYDGQITWTMPGAALAIARVGRYEPTSGIRAGRIVYAWKG